MRIKKFLINHSNGTFWDNVFNKSFGWRFKIANWILGDDLRIELGHLLYTVDNLESFSEEGLNNHGSIMHHTRIIRSCVKQITQK